MRITSNVAAVRTRVARLVSRDIPLALHATLRPEQWREPAEAEAEKTLLALAAPHQREFIPEFLRTLKAEVFGSGFYLRLRSPFRPGQTVIDYQAAAGAVKPGDLGMNLFQKDVEEFEQLLADWVAEQKDKDKRDAGKSDEDIGNWLAYEFLAPDGGHTVRTGSNRGRAVRDAFMPHIVDYLQSKAALRQLDGATVDLWLRAVLTAWRQMVRSLFPDFFRAALRTQMSELNLGGGK